MNLSGNTPTAQRDDEIFDVVNEHDVPVTRATRAEVQALRLRHPYVKMLA